MLPEVVAVEAFAIIMVVAPIPRTRSTATPATVAFRIVPLRVPAAIEVLIWPFLAENAEVNKPSEWKYGLAIDNIESSSAWRGKRPVSPAFSLLPDLRGRSRA